MQLVDAAVVAALEGLGRRRTPRQLVQPVGSCGGSNRFVAGAGQDERIGGALGSAPGLFGCVTNVSTGKAYQGLSVHCAGIGKQFAHAVVVWHCNGSHCLAFPKLYGYVASCRLIEDKAALPANQPVTDPGANKVVDFHFDGTVAIGNRAFVISKRLFMSVLYCD